MHISKHRTYMFLILQKLSRTLRSLGFGLSRETFANFLRVSVLVSENLVSKKSLGFGFRELGLGKKYRFQFRKIRSRRRTSESREGMPTREEKSTWKSCHREIWTIPSCGYTLSTTIKGRRMLTTPWRR